MSDAVQKLEEKLAFMQAEITAMSDELYAQQKEISSLRHEIDKLNAKLKHSQMDSGILNSAEDTPPPHY
ncbi:MAG: SlyX family protein [Alphaproteobacteria bacterium]|nr:SlyX family protein [Alphaproteobacteria bacterium]